MTLLEKLCMKMYATANARVHLYLCKVMENVSFDVINVGIYEIGWNIWICIVIRYWNLTIRVTVWWWEMFKDLCASDIIWWEIGSSCFQIFAREWKIWQIRSVVCPLLKFRLLWKKILNSWKFFDGLFYAKNIKIALKLPKCKCSKIAQISEKLFNFHSVWIKVLGIENVEMFIKIIFKSPKWLKVYENYRKWHWNCSKVS